MAWAAGLPALVVRDLHARGGARREERRSGAVRRMAGERLRIALAREHGIASRPGYD
jgi:hypothetical protein